MDLSKTVTLNGFPFNTLTTAASGGPAYGYQIDEVRHSFVPTTAYVDKRALSDGMDAADIYLNGRLINIDASVFGTSTGDAWDRLDTLIKNFSPIYNYNNAPVSLGFVPLRFYRPTADIVTWPLASYANGIPQLISARPTRPPMFNVPKNLSGGTSGKGLAFKVSLELLAKDPRIYIDGETQTINVGVSTQTATHRGSHPVYPIYTVTMSSAGSSAMQLSVNGSVLYLDLSSISTGTYTVNFNTRTIRDSNDALAGSLFASGRTQAFGQIMPGGSAFFGSSLGGISSHNISYVEAWL